MSKQLTETGQIRDISANAKDTRILSFILSNSDRDRHHTVLNQNNWKLDNYRKNPVVGYMHNLYGNSFASPNPDDVIGQTKRIGIETISGRTVLTGEAYFETKDVNEVADKIFRKLMLGSLRAVSVGFLEIGQGSWGTEEEAQGRKNETYRFAGQELLEWSVVNIPSNASSGKRGMDSMRANTHAALMYACKELGMNYSLSQIENMKVCDILTLLEGKDAGIRVKEPQMIRKMLFERDASGLLTPSEIKRISTMLTVKQLELDADARIEKLMSAIRINQRAKELGQKPLIDLDTFFI